MAAVAQLDASTDQKLKVFISYSRKDMSFADRLEPALKTRAIEPLIDRTEIYAFEDWWKRIQALIGAADAVIFVLSPDAVSSDVCKKEITFAASLNKRFAPIILRRVEDRTVPEELARLNFIFFDDDARFDESVDRLAEALATDIGWVRRHTEFGQDALAWDAAKRPGGLLLRSPLLEEAEHWIASRPHGAPAPTEVTQAFIATSRRATTRRRNILTGSLAMGLAVALGLAGLAYFERGVAIENEATAIKNEKIAEEQRQEADRRRLEAEQRRQEAVVQRDIAEKKTQEAQKNLASAAYFANDVVTKIALKVPSLAALPPEKMIEELGTIDETLIQVTTLVRSAGLMQKNAAVLVQIGALLIYVGDVYANVDARRALRDYDESLAVRRDLAATDPGNMDGQNNIAVSLGRIGDIKLRMGDNAGALKAYGESVEVSSKVVASDPAKANWRTDLAVYYSKHGDVVSASGQREEARADYQKALEIGTKLAADDPADTLAQRNLSVYLRQLGDMLVGDSKNEEALSHYTKARDLREKLAAVGPMGQSDLAEIYARIGSLYWTAGRQGEAVDLTEKSVLIREKAGTADPTLAAAESGLAYSYLLMGDALINEGKGAQTPGIYGKAHTYFEKAAQRIEAKELAEKGKPGEATAAALGWVAIAAVYDKSFERALAVSDQSLALNTGLLWVRAYRAHALMFLGRSREAKESYLAYKGQSIQELANKLWEVVIGEEFDKFRKVGLDRIAGPVMADVETALGRRNR